MTPKHWWDVRVRTPWDRRVILRRLGYSRKEVRDYSDRSWVELSPGVRFHLMETFKKHYNYRGRHDAR